MAGYTAKEELLGATTQTLGASVTAQAVTGEFRFSNPDSLNELVDVRAASVTVGGGITAKLQDSWDKSTWFDVKSVAITADGSFQIRTNVQTTADQAVLPTRTFGRVVVTTGAASAVSITRVMRSTTL